VIAEPTIQTKSGILDEKSRLHKQFRGKSEHEANACAMPWFSTVSSRVGVKFGNDRLPKTNALDSTGSPVIALASITTSRVELPRVISTATGGRILRLLLSCPIASVF
jgi:hypothetical protein